MISSMTGIGIGQASNNGIIATAEVRGVNSRFLEVYTKLPSALVLRENAAKEIVRSKVARGKVNVSITFEYKNEAEIPVAINKNAAKAYHKLLGELQKTLKLKEKISLVHLLKFSEIFEPLENNKSAEEEWKLAERALSKALDDFNAMRWKEGKELMKDLRQRIDNISENINTIEKLSKARVPEERVRLEGRIRELLQDRFVVDTKRLELEVALLADKLDVTEECVRFRSHNKFFLQALSNGEATGRRLNFLVQEMNREANTIGSKSSDAAMTHLAVHVKEELEKIREQLQNIE